MKKGIGYTILVNLVIIIFIGGLININPVSAYQALTIGDQLLYDADFSNTYDYDTRTLFHTDLSPSYNSYWDFTHNEMNSLEKHSYTISNVYPSDYDVIHVLNYQDMYRNDYWDNYKYDYLGSSWYWDGGGLDTNLYSGSDIYFDMIQYFSLIMNLDSQFIFPAMSYSHQTGQSYMINGASTGYTVDVYTYSYADSGMENSSYYYNINYDRFYDISYTYTYYVDNATGFVLEYEYIYDNEEWYNFADKWSTSLGTNITRDYYYDDHTEYHAYLTQTNAAFPPSVTDADLPGIEWDWMYNYDFTADKNYVDIFFWLYDGSQVDLEIYRDGMYIETLYGFTAGYHSYTLYYDDITPSHNSHEFKIIATDVYDSSHQTEWIMWMSDQRLDWPQINGPIGDEWYELGTAKTYFWTLSDDNMDPHYFEFKFDGVIIDDGFWFSGQLLGLNAQVNITAPGDYEVSIFVNDTMGHENYETLMIHASTSDVRAPTVTSPADIYMKPGDFDQINWVITDDNPSHFKVIKNGTIIRDQPWSINNLNVNVTLATLGLGTWIFEIEVWDVFGNFINDTVIVYVTETGTNPTGPSNTITLDSPGILYVLIGFLSITAVTVYVKKRK